VEAASDEPIDQLLCCPAARRSCTLKHIAIVHLSVLTDVQLIHFLYFCRDLSGRSAILKSEFNKHDRPHTNAK
jgi:hypothetical protein